MERWKGGREMKKKEQQYGCGVSTVIYSGFQRRVTHSTAPPTLRHSSSLPPLILEISNSSTVPSKFKPWLAIFSSSLHIPPMIGSRIGFLSFSFQYSDKLSIFFFFFLSFLDFPFLYTYRQLNLSNQTFLIL